MHLRMSMYFFFPLYKRLAMSAGKLLLANSSVAVKESGWFAA